jgi:hypothetical protein
MSTKVLVPELKPGDIVVMDNLSSHKRVASSREDRSGGSHAAVPSTIQPGLQSHRERPSARLKAMLRKAGERTVSGLWTLIGKLVDIFQPDECANYFRSCGYEPD